MVFFLILILNIQDCELYDLLRLAAKKALSRGLVGFKYEFLFLSTPLLINVVLVARKFVTIDVEGASQR